MIYEFIFNKTTNDENQTFKLATQLSVSSVELYFQKQFITTSNILFAYLKLLSQAKLNKRISTI